MSYQYLKQVRKIVCIGRNYAAHIRELNNPLPDSLVYFLKPTSSLVTPVDAAVPTAPEDPSHVLRADGTNPGPILVPQGVEVHHEVELALVLGKRLSNLLPSEFGPEDVYGAISGVALALDLTGRNLQAESKRKGLPWTAGKGFDTFTPISAFVPREALPSRDLQNSFTLRCAVNGVQRQDASTALMLTPMHQLLQQLSAVMTLEPGDIVLTGTPAGVGPIIPGDHISASLLQDKKQLAAFAFDVRTRPGPYMYNSKL
ncbi:AFR024Cp [Eremothecium gossypii ATCC 10895]|uniref:oxaloacetate tautomerase n=1 Tax=Eremothecium gossypii (strain ATCC 10895 / CBS 109.51 / FGSC 9923 / NRRL Y-1056) TaxID=284811 RepID=Q754P8_EREGS|nr:AFR024Cp [Eremothecium gossypii ATCC 10895]AAS53395.1 AFR024Cp [Eremothecium gossypii ATCC 10895]AEY97706.1 FAFR024Cp [Eremothecium gossypii FDAG1]